jgi:hypothetical protein
MQTRRWMGWLLLLLALCAVACGGDGTDPPPEDETGGSATAPATVAAGNRPAAEDQLALIDDSRDPAAYTAVLDSLAEKCRESRTEVADAIVAARRTLTQERGVTVALLDYLRGVDRIVPAGTRDADCTGAATALGQTIGR